MKRAIRSRPLETACLALVVACGGAPVPAPAASHAPAEITSSQGPTTDTTARDDEEDSAPCSIAVSPGDTPEGRAPTLKERRVILVLENAAERVRDLEFRAPIRVVVQTRDMIQRTLAAEMRGDEIERARDLYAALGLLAPDVDVAALVLGVLTEQVVGYYSTRGGYLAVRDDVIDGLGRDAQGSAGLEARVVLVHELVHGLEDQAFDAAARLEDEDADSDATTALHALIEGDASLAMLAYAADEAGIPIEMLTSNIALLRTALQSAPQMLGQALDRAPPIVRIPLLATYIEGMIFGAELYQRGGWIRVNEAFAAVPASTEQVLHPERYLAGQAPETVALPRLVGLETAGWRAVEEDTLGELEISIYLGQGAGGDIDRAAADGWAGDRIRLYERGGKHGVVWAMRWDDEANAVEAETAARRVAALGADGEGGVVSRRGRDLVVVRGLPTRLAGRAIAELLR